jgi:L-lysine exporter family protein LysE/ArgO
MLITPFVAALLSGFGVGAGLAMSIGPQNLFLVRTGANTGRGWAAATVGYSSEIVIFLAAAIWLAEVLYRAPQIVTGLNAFGILFLIWCALRTLHGRCRAFGCLGNGNASLSLHTEVLGKLSVTWLNPLVYLEVGLVVGTLTISQDSSTQTAFAAGFLAASAIKFYGWATVGQRLGPWLGQGDRIVWFNIGSGVVLLVLAASIAWHGLIKPPPI